MPKYSRTALAGALAIGASAIAVQAATADSPSATASRGTTVKMTEFKFLPKTLSAKAGRLRVTAKNVGKVQHEFVLIRTKRAASKLPRKGNQASEKGAIGEIGEQKRGRSASKTFRLKKGRYVFICNVPGHYQAGMRGSLVVE